MHKFFLALMAFVLIAALHAFSQANLAGTYRCVSYNVGGGGGSCRNTPPLVLQSDGSYQMSGERGHYSVRGGLLHLDQSKLRGDGRIQGNQIVFQYQYRGLAQVVTYQRQGGNVMAASAVRAEQAHASVPVDLTIIFRQRDGWIDWVNSAKLIPRAAGGAPKYEELARTDGRLTVKVSFPKGVQTGIVYDLQLGTGRVDYTVAQIDLRQATGPVQKTLYLDVPTPNPVKPPAPNPGPNPAPKPGPAPAPAPAPIGGHGVPCNPNQPHYTQPGCVEGGAQPRPGPQPPPVQGNLCKADVPHYAQPGCVEPR